MWGGQRGSSALIFDQSCFVWSSRSEPLGGKVCPHRDGSAVAWGSPCAARFVHSIRKISGTLNKSLDAVLRGRFLTPVLPEGRAALGALKVLMKNDCTRLLQMLFLLSPMFLPSCSDLFSLLCPEARAGHRERRKEQLARRLQGRSAASGTKVK